MERKYISVKEVSELLGLSKITVHRLAKSGQMPSYLIGRRRLFDKDELIKWVKTHKDKGKQTKRERR